MINLKNIATAHITITHWSIQADECWAIVGRNGSGKKQLGQLLKTTITDSSAESVRLLSFEQQQAFYENELKNDDSEFMDRLDEGTTVRQLLGIEEQSKKNLPARLNFLGLDKILERGYRLLSSGESRKALLAHALLQQPDVLILDEPYDSLDIASKQELSAFFSMLLQEKSTQLFFLLNSLREISAWHTHIAIIENGEIIAQGPRLEIQQNSEIQALLAFDASKLPDWPDDLINPNREISNDLKTPKNSNNVVNLKNGRVSYGDNVIFNQLNISIKQGEHCLITGTNGSGKSTLLSLFTGDHPQSYGNDLKVLNYQRGSGETIWQLKKQIGIVTPELHRNHRVPGNALQIVLSGFFDTIGLYQKISTLQERHAKRWLALVGLGNHAGTSFKSLSYGEQRLVLIARALVKQPSLLILDEPTQGLDTINQHRVMFFLKHLSSQKRTTIIMATHRMDEHLSIFTKHVDLG